MDANPALRSIVVPHALPVPPGELMRDNDALMRSLVAAGAAGFIAKSFTSIGNAALVALAVGSWIYYDQRGKMPSRYAGRINRAASAAASAQPIPAGALNY